MRNRLLASLLILSVISLALYFRLDRLDEPGFTCDEITYVQAGLQLLKGNYEYNYEHPPLAKYLIGTSVHLLGVSEWASRLPVALMGFLTCILTFIIGYNLYGFAEALIAFLILATCTYHIAHSRVATLDVPLSMMYALTVYLFWLGLRRRKYMLLSGIALGLAIGTKYPGVYLVPLMLLYLLLMPLVYGRQDERISLRKLLKNWLGALFIGFITFIIIAPYYFLPLGRGGGPLLLLRSLIFNIHHLSVGHLNFFMGSVTVSPPPWFFITYLMTRLEIPTIVLWIIGLGYALWRRGEKDLIIILWFAVPLAFFSLQKVKLLHYLPPIIPAIALLSGRAGAILLKLRFKGSVIAPVLVLLALMSWQLYAPLQIHPYHLLYFNELVGGAKGAKSMFLIGWGEGLREAAQYVDNQPSEGKVAAWYSHIVSFYCKRRAVLGFPRSLEEAKAKGVKFIITYINQVQRLQGHPLIKYLSQLKPIKTITVKGVELAWIYEISYNASSSA